MTKTSLPIAMVLTAALVLSASAAAQDDATAPEKLIEQLGRANFAERDRAARMLQARGPSVLPALRKALSDPDLGLEERRRLQQLVATLDAIRALEPKRVTLNGNPRPLAAILQDIEKQTGCKLAAEDMDDPTPYRVSADGMLFWEALEKIGGATGHAVSFERDGRAVLLKRAARRPPLVQIQGAFRLEATRFHEDRDIDFTKPGKGKDIGLHERLLTLTVSVLAEPRFALLSVESIKIDVAVDEHGNVLGTPPGKRSTQDPFRLLVNPLRRDYQHFQQTVELFLERTSDKARKVKELRGAIMVVVAERKNVVVTQKFLASNGTKIRVGADTVEITYARMDDDGYTVQFALPPTRGGVYPRWQDRFFLEDAAGNRYAVNSNGGYGTSDGILMDITIGYAKSDDPNVGPPTRLIFEDWGVYHHTIPFAFKDVPLP